MRAILVLSALALASVPGGSSAQSGGAYEIVNSSIDGGAERSGGGSVDLQGTVGQPDASAPTVSGGSYSLTGGFWAFGTTAAPTQRIFADGFES